MGNRGQTWNPFKFWAPWNDHGLSRTLLSCFSAEGHLLCFSNWQIKRSEKDWISLKFTAARLQWKLCVCLYYYLSGWKHPSVFSCLRKAKRNNGVFNFRSCFKSAQLWFFFLAGGWARGWDGGWCIFWWLLASRNQYSTICSDVKVDVHPSSPPARTCLFYHLAFNNLHNNLQNNFNNLPNPQNIEKLLVFNSL